MQNILQNQEIKEFIVELLSKILNLKFKDIIFDRLEEFKNIAEYDFYLICFVAITENGTEKEIFFKKITKGKIKESLFCICDLIYEKYFSNTIEDDNEHEKKLIILEEKIKSTYMSKIIVNLCTNKSSKIWQATEINFIEISSLIEQIDKFKKKGWDKYIEINPKDIIIIGVKNKY